MSSSCCGANAHGADNAEQGGGRPAGACGSVGVSGNVVGGHQGGLDKQLGNFEAGGHEDDGEGADDGGSPAWAALLRSGQCGELACLHHHCTCVWCTY